MMSMHARIECVNEIRVRYRKATRRSEKSILLSELCRMTGYDRKYANVLLLSAPVSPKKRPLKRSSRYTQETRTAILDLWRAAGEICGERLHPFIPDLLEQLEHCGRMTLTAGTRTQVLTVSLGTVKRIVGKEKRRSLIRIGGTTKPGSLLKHQIAVRTGPWNETEPGWMEMDTVAHCGNSLQGSFLSSLDLVDVYSHWSEQYAISGCTGQAVEGALTTIRKSVPFPLKGLDPDNGSEFINWSIYWYCKREEIGLTRSRPGKKNDNAHIEQKNWTAIRQLVGYARMEGPELQALLNDLYRNEWRLFVNFFQPTQKIREKHFDPATGKTKRIYEKARTPY